jgi:putative ABC transport system ATP-binding protein
MLVDGNSPAHDHASQACAVMEHFARHEGLSFDRTLARRTLHESSLAIIGDDAESWGLRLVECGESLDLRIQLLECKFKELMQFVNVGIPVASVQISSGPDFGWIVADAIKGSKIRIHQTRDNSTSWVSSRKFARMLGLNHANDTTRLVIAQRPLILSGDGSHASAKYSSSAKKLTPFRRLMVMIQPEWGDIRAIFVFSLVVGLLSLTTPIAVEALVNTVAFGRYLQPVVILSLMLFTFLTFSAALTATTMVVVEMLQRRLFVRVVEDLAFRIPRVQQSAMDGRNPYELLNRFFDVVTIQKVIPKILMEGLASVMQTVLGMAVLAFYHPFLLGFDIVLLVLFLFAVFVMGRGAVKSAIYESKKKYATAAWLEELAANPTAFHLNGGMGLAMERADKRAVDYLDARRKHFKIVLRQYAFVLGLYVVAATVLLGLGGWLVIQGQLTLGQLVASELIVMLIVRSFLKLGAQLESIYDLLASVDKIGELLDLAIEPHDQMIHMRQSPKSSVKVKSVSASLHGKAVLSDLSLKLEPGTTVAVCGPSGSGKSALADLLCGLRQPDSGAIEIDGNDLRELRTDAIREQVGLSRGIEIFAGTIDENIHLGRTSVLSNDVRKSLEIVGAAEMVMNLSEGPAVELQTGGSPLPSALRLRLMLARALVGNPRLLIIDGTLDAFPLDEVLAIITRIKESRVNPTLLLTARREIAELCEIRWSLNETGNLGELG